MKKVVKVAVLFGTLISLIGCKSSGEVTLNIISMNDTHGALIETHASAGLIKGASYIESVRKENKKGTIILSAGDMYQGTAVSNMEYGNTMIECMNALEFDAMTVGNHEFDWGEEIIKNHHDGNFENGEANYPYIGCNIFYNNGTEEISDDTRVDWCKDYVVIERKNVRVGVVGWISEECMQDIAEPIVKNFSFHSPLPLLKDCAKKLRSEENCDIVIALGHEGSELNNSIMKFPEESRINLIINGHTHTYYTNDRGIPSVQSGSSLEYIANTTIKYDKKSKEILSVIPYQEKITKDMEENREVKKILDERLINYQYLFEEITKAGINLTTSRVGQWVSECIKQATASDVGIVNSGGIRKAAFPIYKGDSINEDRMWMLMPFDNEINTCYLKGSQIRALKTNSDGFVFDFAYKSSEWEDDKLYKVAACDYIFNKTIYPFLKGQKVTETKLLVRDIIIKDLREWGKQNIEWDASKSLLSKIEY